MESLLKNLKKHVECSICLDTFTEPKTIACLHTFCCECLKKHALVSQRDGQFRCPECQAQIAVPEGNRFDLLPTSFHHNSLLGLLAVQQIGDGKEISCGICKKKSANISYCFDCEKLLCSDCVNAHELFRQTAFEGHKVTPVKQFQAKDYEGMLKRQAFCSQKYHEREVTRFYCRNCQACVCQVCLVTEHKNHDIEPLEKAADNERAKILAGTELIREKEQVCSDVIRKFEEAAINLDTNCTDARRQVSQAAEQMIAAIREREREAIAALENTRVSRMEKLDTTKKKVQLVAKQINQAAEFASDLAQRSSSADIFQSNNGLQERFEELSKMQVPPLPVSSFVKFVPICSSENSRLGCIKTSETDPNRSIVEGLSETFQAGKRALIYICPKTDEGEPSIKHADQVEVVIEPVDQVAGLMINKQSGGNFGVNFIPKVPGVYNITAKINEEKLPKSPFTIQVKERLLEIEGELDLQNQLLRQPAGIAVNSEGLIAVADSGNGCIKIFDKEGKYVRQLGNKGKNPGKLVCPRDVTFVSYDEVLVADEDNNRIQKFNVHTGLCVNSFGKKGSGGAEFYCPRSVCMDGQGRVVVADYLNNRVQVLTKDGVPVFNLPDGSPKLNYPQGCVFHKDMLIVCDNKCLQMFDSSDNFLYKIGKEGEADGQFKNPMGVCVDKHDNILVCDYSKGNVQQFSFDGHFTGKSVAKLQHPWGVTTMPDGRILVAGCGMNKVFIMK